jgi:hypothetical protein
MLIDEQDSDIFTLSELAECGFDTMNLGFCGTFAAESHIQRELRTRFNDGEILLALRNLTNTG